MMRKVSKKELARRKMRKAERLICLLARGAVLLYLVVVVWGLIFLAFTAHASDDYNYYEENPVEAAYPPGPSSPVPASEASSNSEAFGCGETTGAAAQGESFGVSIGSIPEGCRAVQAAEASTHLTESGFEWRARAVTAAYWIGYMPRLVVHVVSGGILN